MDKQHAVIPRTMEGVPETFGFAPAVKSGDMVYCSGMIGVGDDGKVPNDPEAQFSIAFDALEMILTAAGSSFDKVVDLTTFHIDLNKHIELFARVKARYIQQPYIAWTAIGTSELAYPGALVEVKLVARL